MQRFGEILGWCHPVEGLSRPSVELVGCEVEVVLGEGCHVGAFVILGGTGVVSTALETQLAGFRRLNRPVPTAAAPLSKYLNTLASAEMRIRVAPDRPPISAHMCYLRPRDGPPILPDMRYL